MKALFRQAAFLGSVGLFFAGVGLVCSVKMLQAQESGVPAALAKPSDTPTPTVDDQLNLQIVLLKSQLAQTLAMQAKCEAEGPSSTKVSQEAQADGQVLLKSLDARGMTIDPQKNIIVPKPKTPDKIIEPPKATP